MNHNRLYFLLLLFAFSLGIPGLAQKRCISQDWNFCRISDETSKAEIKNQGSDWSSQYNVQHMDMNGNSELAVPQNTLGAELRQLENKQWEQITLPHTPFVEPLTVLHQWQGICYYKKKITITPEEAKKHIWIEFEGAMHLADVWINGKYVMQHAGGYTPFVVDATGLLKTGKENELLVRLDNRNNSLISPGKPLETLDFCYYGGIYRNVHLIAKADVHITHPILDGHPAGAGIFITYPKVSQELSVVDAKTEIKNTSDKEKVVELRHTLYTWKKQKGKDKKVQNISETLTLHPGVTIENNQRMEVKHPALWSPDEPNLYVLSTEVVENGKVVDKEETRIGIRHIEMSIEKGFVINGKPLRLVGSNRHMEYPYVGNAISDQAQYRDMYQIRSNGFNIVRLGHYPQATAALDACDELGLLAIEPIPGWQFFNKNPLFISLTHRDVRDMIRRDRNHPSIVMWETTLNESWPPAEWKEGVVKIAHEELPGDQCFTSGDSYGYKGFDVCYNDWEEGFKRPNNSGKPGFIREYYDYEFGGHYSTTRIRRGDGEKAQLQNAWNAQWSHNRYRIYYPKTMGDAVWSMYDYNRGCCDNICYSGVADIFRLPKFSLSFFRTQIAEGSMLPSGKMPYEVFIPAYRDEILSETVMVYGNVDEVELVLNGKTIRRQTADKGPDSDYIPVPNGGNGKNLHFPPFTFYGVPKERGVLKAVGYHQGKKVAEYTVKTPGVPERLDITYFESDKPATKNDLLIVYVRMLDKQGVLCPVNGIPVELSVQGGEIVGPTSYPLEAGVASFLVRTGEISKININATGKGFSTRKSLKVGKE